VKKGIAASADLIREKNIKRKGGKFSKTEKKRSIRKKFRIRFPGNCRGANRDVCGKGNEQDGFLEKIVGQREGGTKKTWARKGA